MTLKKAKTRESERENKETPKIASPSLTLEVKPFSPPGQDLNSSAYEREGRILLQLAQDLNDRSVYFPVWGTCLGFELMALHFTGKNVLSSCNSYDQTLPLDFTLEKEQLRKSKLFNSVSDEIFNVFSTQNVTFNYHKKCLTRETFNNTPLKDTFDVLSLNHDKNGLEFISTFEAKEYPMYGVQFHPEKNIYEFVNQKHNHATIPHDFNAVLASQYFANFFVNECRKNNHTWDAEKDASSYPLIYSFTPEHTIEVESFEQMYFFKRTI